MTGFLPPVIFEVQANAAGAIAQFRKVNTELSVMEANALKAGKALTGFQKAAVVGTKALKVLTMAFAAFAAYGVKQVMDLEKSLTRLGKAMANVGVASQANLSAISELVESYEGLGFGSDKAADAYTTLITATGDVEKSNKLLAMSADLARARTIGLEDASKLLVRAQAGNVRLFTQFGITLDKTLPKAQAIEKAMKQLEGRLGGQAEAYAKTFAGQLAILNENLGDLAEAIGMRVLPLLNKFVSGLNNAGSFIKKNEEFVIALTLAITVALIPAVVSLTKKLIILAATILKSPIGRLAVIIFAASYAFIKLYNASEDFRKGFATVVKFVITGGEVIYRILTTVYNGLLLMERGGINARIALGKLFGKDEWVKDGQAALKAIDDVNAGFKNQIKKFDDYRKAVDTAFGKKITLSFNFKVPQIPKFDSGEGLDDFEDDINQVSEALINARQRVIDFNIAMKETARDLKGTWSGIVGKDVKKAIEEGLLNPVDKLIVQAQKSVDAYQGASNAYTKSVTNLTAAQNAYTSAVAGSNKTLIASTTSALKRAEDGVSELQSTMQKSLEDMSKLQESMIDSIIESYNKINDLEKERTEVLETAQTERFALEKQYNKDTAALRKQYARDVLNAQQEATKRTAEIVKQSVDQLRGIYKTATQRSVGDIFSGLTFGGLYSKGGTTEKILKALGLQTAKAKTLADDAAQLAGLGFNQTFIEEVVAQGPDVGHKLAQTIINGTPESIKQMKAYWEALQKQSNHGIDSVANYLNTTLGVATEELRDQLLQVGIDLNAQLAEYQANLTEALADAFADYSEALDEINTKTAKTVTSIDGQIKTLQSSIAQLQTALANLGKLSAPGVTAVAPKLTKPTGTAADAANAAADALDAKNAQDEADLLAFYKKHGLSSTGKQLYDVSGVAQKSLLQGLSGGAGVAGAVRGANYAAQLANNYNIQINAETNASSQAIAADVAWAIRTSGDIQYRTASAK